MKTHILIIFSAFLSLNSYGQIIFEKGYFIDNSDQKTECLIKNNDWKNNPTSFKYKLSIDGIERERYLSNTKEFVVYDYSKYIRFEGDVERSSKILRELTYEKNPVFNKEQIFLKVLIEGEASLYLYEGTNLKKFFFNVHSDSIEQLIHIAYLNLDSKISKNNYFRQQLWNKLKCNSNTIDEIKKLKFKNTSLNNFFLLYNKCKQASYLDYTNLKKRKLFKLNIKLGLDNSKFRIQNALASPSYHFENSLSLRIGFEVEYILPFNKNKWALFLEPSFQSYKGKSEENNVSSTISFNSIELPVGVKHNFFLDKESKLFLTASLNFDFLLYSDLLFNTNSKLDLESRNNLAFGIGYQKFDKYSVEFRFQTPQELLSDFVFWTSNYNTMSLIFGYTFYTNHP